MDHIGDFINRQKWLAPVEAVLGTVANIAFNTLGQKVRNFLHGTWLGHPLHPVITDVPIGAWTAAALLDSYELATGDDTFAPGADVAVGVGLLGAAGAAVCGLNDWQATSGKPKRVGVVHALFNLTATAFYVASWYQRRNGSRRAGLTSALTGYALSFAGAWLGGHLVFHERIGVNHAPGELPERFVPIMDESDLSEDKIYKAEVDGIPLLVVRRGGRIHVLAEKCSHLGGPLAEGELDGGAVTCPWHGSKFALCDGSVINGPATYAQPCLEVRTRKKQIEVRARPGTAPEPY